MIVQGVDGFLVIDYFLEVLNFGASVRLRFLFTFAVGDILVFGQVD